MKTIPQPTIERLLIYYRFLEKITKFNEIEYITSLKMGRKLGISPVIIRKDLSFCQKIGCKGVGYEVFALKKTIGKVLGVNSTWPVVLIGAGNIGQALINHHPFQRLGVNIVAIFDCDLNKIGQYINEIEIKSMKDLEKTIGEKNIKTAILAVPASEASRVALKLVKAGVRAIWNFAPVSLKLSKDVVVYTNDISSGVASLICRLNNGGQ